ncbi:MAG: 4Fe-4S dicluster domain-containing protein, partial [Gammaproteobacteria bacterium]|nr:4Fe-4S dicluster domain-containing protein [Gammaproteobacteria bacterium]
LEIVQRIRALGIRERDEVARRFPKLLRRVGGYNIDTIDPAGHNMAHLLVGSEGTLGFFTEIELALEPFPAHRVLGVCHFETFYAAMEATQQIVALDPTAVELVDRTLMDLANDIDMFRPTLERFIRGRPEALLLVEFAGDALAPLNDRLGQLESLMADLGHPDSVVQTTEPGFQSAIWDIRKAGLNIMMSMKGEGKPVSFVEDCAVRLEDLPEYTRRLDEIFAKHGTRGTWYAHASVGTLHVRPILNMKQPEGARAMREIAEECFEMVRAYEGSHSGEHGDGLVRSEFHEAMFGERLVKAFEEVKRIFDPAGLFNPGKIVHAERMDDRGLFRYKPDYRQIPVKTELDWSDWGGLHGAVEMCNNNGACRKSNPGVMCPSYRVTLDERHVTRGRANTLRLALTGQLDGHLGDAALTSETLYDAFDLCVSCKGCRRECPTGVDMARMKIEFLSQYRQRHGWRLKHKLIAHLPRYAPWAAALAPLANARDLIPGLAWATEGLLGLSAKRPLPRWRRDAIQAPPTLPDPDKIDVLLFVDTFSRWFEPDNVRAAQRVLQAGGYRVGLAGAKKGKRPLCCGRTYLGTGMMDRARSEAVRTRDALLPFADRGIPILGLEPSCLFTFHDEFTAMLPGASTQAIAQSSMLLEQFLFREHEAGRLELGPLKPSASQAFVHGHCHQKAFGAFDDTLAALRLVPGLEATPIESSCCGMAGPFGYEPEHYEMSMKMGELNLLPAVRNAPPEAIIVAGGTSCRQQIQHGTGRNAMHPIRVLADALD